MKFSRGDILFSFEIELALMAKDVEIQAELDKIDKEFVLTENDGL